MKKYRAMVTAAIMVTVSLVAPPAIAGDSGWSPPRILAAGDFPSDFELATDRRGRITVVQNVEVDSSEQLVLRHMRSSGALRSDVVTVSQREQFVAHYDLAVDDDGDAVVVWQIPTGDQIQWQVYARRISRSGDVGPIVRVSDPTQTSTLNGVAVTPGGLATIVYQRGITESESATVVARLGTDSDLRGRTSLPLSWTSPRPVASRSGHVAFALSGDGTRPARAVRITPSGRVRTRQLDADLAGGGGQTDLAVDRRGNVYAVVARQDGGRAWVRTWRRNGSLTNPRRVSPRGEAADHVLIRTDLAGDSVVLTARYGPDDSLRLSGRFWSGALGPRRRLGSVNGSDLLGIEIPGWSASIADDGETLLSWEVHIDHDEYLRAARVSPSGRFTKVARLGRGAGPSALTTPSGRHYLTYYREDIRDNKIVLRTHD